MPDTMIEHAADAAWAHLEAAYSDAKSGNDPAYVDRGIQIIDGTVDMAGLVRVILTAMREPTQAMVEGGVSGSKDDYGNQRDAAGTPSHLLIAAYRAMIDAALAEG